MLSRPGHWLADALRFAWALWYWNLRKTLYVWRSRTGRCPCQNESDDSIPGRVRCDAVLFWHDPGRFRHICPLLVRTGEGWRCSVHASQVRPFWGRVVRLGLVSFGVVWLAGTLVVLAGLRGITGAPVGWLQVAWPGRWSEIPRVQSRHLFRQAIQSFQRGELAVAHLTLSAALTKDPDNYDAALLLAQIEMFQRNFAFSDGLFVGLRQRHPEQALRTAIVYHDTLLGNDRQRMLAGFSIDMARTNRAHAAVWVRSALLALRSMRPAEVAGLAALLPEQEGGLAEHARRLIHAELALQTGARTEALALLREPFPGPYNPFYVGYQIERLAELGASDDAQWILDQQGPLLGEFEHLRLQVALARLTGDVWGARAAFAALLKQSLAPVQVERLAGLLITYPDRELFQSLHERIRHDPKLSVGADGAALWVAALVCQAMPEARFWRDRSRTGEAAGVPDIEEVDFSRRDVLQANTAVHLINTVTFPREVILALLWRTDPQSDPKTRNTR